MNEVEDTYIIQHSYTKRQRPRRRAGANVEQVEYLRTLTLNFPLDQSRLEPMELVTVTVWVVRYLTTVLVITYIIP